MAMDVGSFGFLTQQLRGVHKDLLAFQARTEERFNKIENDVQVLRRDMPGIVGSAVREVLAERRGKS
jgi:hypothetical protein